MPTDRLTDAELAAWEQLASAPATRANVYAARAALPALLAEVRRLRAENERAATLISEAYGEWCQYIYAPVALLPTDGSKDTDWMKRAQQFLEGSHAE